MVHWKVLNITIRALGGHMSVLGEVLGGLPCSRPFFGLFQISPGSENDGNSTCFLVM